MSTMVERWVLRIRCSCLRCWRLPCTVGSLQYITAVALHQCDCSVRCKGMRSLEDLT